ncbi:MAG: HmuY family protein [Schleiferiaceae bacterium]|nr:HmuY family protein [Schleiferiaceae bacterium]
MRKALLSMTTAVAVLSFTSCSKDDNTDTNKATWSGETVAVTDLDGTEGPVFFSLRENKIIDPADSATARWDVYFNGTTILLNGGSSGIGEGEGQVVAGLFDEAVAVPNTGWVKDQPGNPALSPTNGNAWYIYNDGNANPPHAILMAPGRVVWVKTADGQTAKIELLSYYKGNPDTSTEAFASLMTRPPSRFYNFRFSIEK